MSKLIHAQPTAFWQQRNPDTPFMAVWYYGTNGFHFSVGQEYGVVYSPNPYASPGYEYAGWRYIVFEVRAVTDVRGHTYNGHVEMRKRLLTAEEIVHFEGLLAGLRRTA